MPQGRHGLGTASLGIEGAARQLVILYLEAPGAQSVDEFVSPRRMTLRHVKFTSFASCHGDQRLAQHFSAEMPDAGSHFDRRAAILDRLGQLVEIEAAVTDHIAIGNLDPPETLLTAELDTAGEMVTGAAHMALGISGIRQSPQGTRFSLDRLRLLAKLQAEFMFGATAFNAPHGKKDIAAQVMQARTFGNEFMGNGHDLRLVQQIQRLLQAFIDPQDRRQGNPVIAAGDLVGCNCQGLPIAGDRRRHITEIVEQVAFQIGQVMGIAKIGGESKAALDQRHGAVILIGGAQGLRRRAIGSGSSRILGPIEMLRLQHRIAGGEMRRGPLMEAAAMGPQQR